MSHCRRQATEGAEFQISCKRLKELRKAGQLQVIQNKHPWCSVAAYVTAGLPKCISHKVIPFNQSQDNSAMFQESSLLKVCCEI